jgi:cellulose synthase/poly-beta-1,6-N-acetylglucosamine synthase-like glycosyltransferase
VKAGVSFVVPVHNGAACLEETLAAIAGQDDGRPMEIIAVDDRSGDESADILERLAGRWPMRVLGGEGRGAAAALNVGIRAARFPLICQIDQDVVVGPDWMQQLTAELDDRSVGAAQGYFETDPRAGLYARVMNFDLEQRYASIERRATSHVCTGNTVYRAAALHAIGLFDESLGYGYDNDVSYRLLEAGYTLTLCRRAGAVHRWREGLRGYLVQQYGFGYGRIDVVAKHPSRVSGDSVSPARMMAQPLVTMLALCGYVAAAAVAAAGGVWRPLAAAARVVVAAVFVERLTAGVLAARRFRSAAPLAFPVVHLARNLAWVAAIVVWTARRLRGRRSSPAHSMRPRTQL